jgi:hypothetical protein
LVQYRYNMQSASDAEGPRADGFIVTLADLKRALESISTPTVRWMVTYTSPSGAEAPKILVRHRNDEIAELETDISFIFPVAERRSDKDEDTLVCLHPETMDTHSAGLYAVADGVQPDLLADFDTFWPPLQAALESLHA